MDGGLGLLPGDGGGDGGGGCDDDTGEECLGNFVLKFSSILGFWLLCEASIFRRRYSS